MGDTPYSDAEEAQLRPMIQRMNAERLAFVVHVGDIISGRGDCSDRAFAHAKSIFDAFAHPFILTPGDNEWTDCHRGGFDPLQSLERIRTLFHSGDRSIGRRTIPLIRQSNTDRDRKRHV